MLDWDTYTHATGGSLSPAQLRAATVHLHHRGMLLYLHRKTQEPVASDMSTGTPFPAPRFCYLSVW